MNNRVLLQKLLFLKCVYKTLLLGVFVMSGKTPNESVVTALYLNFNLICSIVIVLLNKWVYVNIGFPNLTLTLLHFLTTFVGLNICERFNLFHVKLVPLREVYLLSATFCGFVIFTNLSLQYNTVGTYQLAKVMTTPLVIILQMLLFKKKFTLKVKCTLVPIIIGVLLNFYYDLKFNVLGTLFAVCGFFVTSVYQILVSTKQHELQMNPMQLLYYQAPLSSVLLLVFVFYFEPPFSTLSHIWTFRDILTVLLSCIIAFFLNVSIYWIIGKTSPLTYNMLGHFKFCLTVIGGYVIFKEPLTFMQIIGVLMTLCGVTCYAQVKLNENKDTEKSLEEG